MPNSVKCVVDDLFDWLSRPRILSGVNEISYLDSAIATSQGFVRKQNQDCGILARLPANETSSGFSVAILCDGIGGLQSGEICSRLATASILANLITGPKMPVIPRLIRAVRETNDLIYSEFRENGGTTLSLIFCSKAGLFGINIGDSRIYRIGHNICEQLTTDDNIGNQLKMIKPDSLTSMNTSISRQLTQFIGLSEGLDISPFEIPFNSVDRGFLMTSDGVHYLPEKTFEEIAICAPNAVDRAKRFSAICRWGYGADNATLISIGKSFCDLEQDKLPQSLAVWDAFSEFNLPLRTLPHTLSVEIPTIPSKLKRDTKKKILRLSKNKKIISPTPPSLDSRPTDISAKSESIGSNQGNDQKSQDRTKGKKRKEGFLNFKIEEGDGSESSY